MVPWGEQAGVQRPGAVRLGENQRERVYQGAEGPGLGWGHVRCGMGAKSQLKRRVKAAEGIEGSHPEIFQAGE